MGTLSSLGGVGSTNPSQISGQPVGLGLPHRGGIDLGGRRFRPRLLKLRRGRLCSARDGYYSAGHETQRSTGCGTQPPYPWGKEGIESSG